MPSGSSGVPPLMMPHTGAHTAAPACSTPTAFCAVPTGSAACLECADPARRLWLQSLARALTMLSMGTVMRVWSWQGWGGTVVPAAGLQLPVPRLVLHSRARHPHPRASMTTLSQNIQHNPVQTEEGSAVKGIPECVCAVGWLCRVHICPI